MNIKLASHPPLAHTRGVVIKETHFFTKIINELMPDGIYAKLQEALVCQPDRGDLIPGTGGLRKIRWNIPGTGKRGGVRVIYYWLTMDDEIYMLFAYAKAKRENLSHEQINILRRIVAEELYHG